MEHTHNEGEKHEHHDHAEHAHHETKHKKHTKEASAGKMLTVGILSALFVLLLAAAAFVILGVRNGSENGFVVAGAKLFNIPVASINDLNVSYGDYVMDKQALRTYSEKNGAGSTPEEESDRALSRLLVNRLVKNMADEKNIKVEDSDKEKAIATLKSQFPDEKTLEEEMKASFGWDLDTFVDRIVVPSLLEQKVAEAYALEPVKEGETTIEQVKARHILFPVDDAAKKDEVKAQAQKVLDRIKAGESFETLAGEFGTDSTKDKGGDLGWFGKGVMVPEFETPVWALQPGQLGSELVETSFGFHIVRVDEKRSIKDFTSYLDSELTKADIDIFGKTHNPFETGAPALQ